MFWQFTLDDGTTQLVLDTEPAGWDAGQGNIFRDGEKHGVAFDYVIGNVRYYDEGADFLRAAYEAKGTEAKVNVIIKYACYEGAPWQDFYTGKLDFGTYKEFAGFDCYIMVNTEATDVVMTFNNRFDQKVNLETTTSFDGVALTNYDFLGGKINLYAKAIPIQDKAIVNDGTNVYAEFAGGLQEPYNSTEPIGVETNLNYVHHSIGFNNTIASEIGNFFVGGIDEAQVFNGGNGGNFGDTFQHHVAGELNPAGVSVWPLGVSPIINYTEGSPAFGWLNGLCRLQVHFRGTIENPNTYLLGRNAFLIGVLPKSTRSDFGTRDEDYRWIYGVMVNDSADANDFIPPGGTVNISATCDLQFQLNEGDRVYMFITAEYRTSQAQIDAIQADTSVYAYNVNFIDDESYIILDNLSFGGLNSVSPCKSYLVNETLSRITEAITNDQMRVYSDYFGRTDAQPYTSPADGCGALEMVTNGLFIRGVDEVRTATPPTLTLSLDDVFKGLNPIHNLGFGIEDDPNRAGYKILRVEPVEYFYPNTVIFTASDVEVLTKSCDPSKIYSIYQFGYDKWEAQQFTGLDEFLTKREYRTSLTSVKNTLNQISDFIASGYTIEIVRRIGHETSQDNTYDNDTFIVCLRRTPPGESFNVTYTFNANEGGSLTVDGIEFSQYVASKGDARVNFLYNGVLYYLIPNSNDTVNGVIVSTQTDFNNSGIDNPAVFTIYEDGAYQVEQGNLINATNIIDPDTIYNYRISPARNAMRWVKSVFQSYKNLPEQIIFTSGDGNVYASGQLEAGDPCKLENSDIQENMTITPAIFANAIEAAPIYSPELINFEYPLSVDEFINIKSNRMGLIAYDFKGETGQGWISELKYTFETGMAEFTLIPKY